MMIVSKLIMLQKLAWFTGFYLNLIIFLLILAVTNFSNLIEKLCIWVKFANSYIFGIKNANSCILIYLKYQTIRLENPYICICNEMKNNQKFNQQFYYIKSSSLRYTVWNIAINEESGLIIKVDECRAQRQSRTHREFLKYGTTGYQSEKS